MPVALEKSVEIRTRLVEAINEGRTIDEFTVRKIQYEIKNEKSYIDKAMLNALFNVATKNYAAAYESFSNYIKLDKGLLSQTDYLTFLTQLNDYEKAYSVAVGMYDTFGRNYGESHLVQLYNTFRSVSDIQMMKRICEDLEAIQSELAESLKGEAQEFIDHYATFCEIANAQDGELKKVLLAAYSVLNSVVLQDDIHGIDVAQLQYHQLPTHKECGIIMTLSNATVDLAADMNCLLADKLLERDIFPTGNWSLWFEPAIL